MAAHIVTGTMVHPQYYSSKQLGHLGWVAGMYDELGIGELIAQLLPQDQDKRTVSIGQAVKAMVLKGLGFVNRSVYLMPQFFSDKPVERLIGEGIEAHPLNDDALGRVLDAIWEYGPPSQSAFHNLEVEYGEVRQRWVVVFSPDAYQRARKTVDKQCGKQSTAELKAFSLLINSTMRLCRMKNSSPPTKTSKKLKRVSVSSKTPCSWPQRCFSSPPSASWR